jgi:putative transposase
VKKEQGREVQKGTVMTIKRKQHSAQFKFRVALAAAKEEKTLSQLASEYGVHPGQISQWKRQLLSEGVEVFGRNGPHPAQVQDTVQAELYEQIGRLKMELEWLKKKAAQFS